MIVAGALAARLHVRSSMDLVSHQEMAAKFSVRDAARRMLALRSAMVRLRAVAAAARIDAALSGRIRVRGRSPPRCNVSGSCRARCTTSSAFRLVVPWTSNCYRLAGIIADEFEVLAGEHDDYIASPKANGYRSIHTTIVGRYDFPIEVQLRTSWMNDTAERGRATRLLAT